MSNSLRSHGLQPARLLCPWDSPGKKTRVDCHALLQGSNPCLLWLLHCRLILYHWATGEVQILSSLSISVSCLRQYSFFFKKYLFIWLHCVLVALCKIFCCHAQTLVAAPGLSFLTACGILVLQLGITPSSPALHGRFLTTGLPEKSPGQLLLIEMMQFIPWRSKELFDGALECQEVCLGWVIVEGGQEQGEGIRRGWDWGKMIRVLGTRRRHSGKGCEKCPRQSRARWTSAILGRDMDLPVWACI